MLFRKRTGPESREPKILHRKSSRRATKQAASLGKPAIKTQNGPQKPSLFKFTMRVLYKNLYLIGITLLRRRLRLKRKIKLWSSKIRGILYTRLRIAGKSIRGLFMRFWGESKAPFLRIRRTYNEYEPYIKAQRAKGRIPFRAYSAIAETVLRLIIKIFATVFNYTAPVVAVGALIMIIGRYVSQPIIVAVEYQGEYIGYIQNESEFYAATEDVLSRVTTDGETAFEIYNPHFEYMTEQRFNTMRRDSSVPMAEDAGELQQDELADKLIKASGSEVDEAYGLYIDNTFYGAVLNKDPILNEFNRIKNAGRTSKPDEELEFVNSIRLKPGLYPTGSITPESDIIAVLNRKDTAEETYIVKEGDTPTGIAEKTGIPYETLKNLNPDIEDKLMEGMEVLTQVAKPFMSVQTVFTDVIEEEVPYETVKVENATYARGYEDVFQEGEDGLRRVTYRVKSVDGVERERAEMSFEMLRDPVDERITVGINDPEVIASPPPSSYTPAQPGGNQSGGTQAVQPAKPQDVPAQTPTRAGFIRPVPAGVGYISCYLNGYRGHTGIDIAVTGGTGTPILASASGTVVRAQYTRVGYGNYVIIDHGNGYQTLYAHNSALYVSTGERVAQGQVIAAMGRTGNATGVHCHFEVRYGGRIMNPTDFVGSR